MKFQEHAEKIPGILKEYRARRGYSQTDVADLIHMTKDAYARYEQGKNAPTLDKLLSLCELYNVTPNILLGYEDTGRVNAICDNYGVRYETLNDNKVRVLLSERKSDPDLIVSFPGFQEILFEIVETIQANLTQEYEEYRAMKELERHWFQTLLGFRIVDYNCRIENKGVGIFDKALQALEKMSQEEIIEKMKGGEKNGDKK